MTSRLQMLCLGERGLQVFATTADQRYLIGPDVFLRTHYPMTMRRFANGRCETMREKDLLGKLLDKKRVCPGNRVFIRVVPD